MLLPALVLLICAVARADDSLPPKFQAILFKKIFLYDRTLDGKGKIRVLVVEDPGGESSELVQAFSAEGFESSQIKPTSIAEAAGRADVLYVTKSTPAIREFCETGKVLSISSSTALVKGQEVAVAIHKKSDGKPEILVSLPRTKKEGQDIAGEFLGLVTVVQ